MLEFLLTSMTFVSRLLHHEQDCHDHDEIPLDGSDVCRLVNMRIRREQHFKECGKCRTDFWMRIHSIGSPLWRCRQAHRKALLHWFIKGEDFYDPDWALSFNPALAGQFMVAISESSDPIETLKEAEKQWDAQQKQMPRIDNKDHYWFWDKGAMGEPRPSRTALVRRMLASTGNNDGIKTHVA